MARRIPPQACSSNSIRITKQAVIKSFRENTSTRDYLESLDDDQWRITSFNPEDREVCFDMTSDHGMIHHMTVTLPVLSLSWIK
jgi:hypothetical protein